MKCGSDTKIWHPELSVLLDCVIGNHCVIHSHVWIGNNVVIGDACKIQAFSFIPDGVKIGSGVFIGPRVTFTNDLEPPSTEWLETVVEDGVVIGAGAVILPGVTLGAYSRVGAGAVVTRDIYPGDWWVGNPARQIERYAP
jgi:UDP-2-acetamido-3-amino-2,3-dideoxy-glucuronate N-acetyltransferase